MQAKTIANGILRAVAIMVGVALLAYFLYQIRSVLAYLVIAAVVALLGRPLVRFLRDRLRFPNSLAVVVSMGLMIGLFLGVLALFIPLITEQGRTLSLLDRENLKKDINSLYIQVMESLGARNGAVNELLKEAHLEDSVFKNLDFGFIPNLLNSFVNTLSNFSVGFFSVLFISFFFLKDSKLLQRGLMTFVPQTKEGKLAKTIDKINDMLSRYFSGLLLQLFILFVIYTIVLLIFGVENAIVIAFLCALFNIIPYVGPLIGGLIMVTLTMTSYLGADVDGKSVVEGTR